MKLTACAITIVALCFIAGWSVVGSLLCCAIDADKQHWWCPICLLFGKRRIP